MPARLIEFDHGQYVLSTDPTRVDAEVVHEYLSRHSYWAAGRPREVTVRAIAHSHLVMGAYAPGGDQVGFARMVTDLATYAWLADVFVLPAHRGGGLGTALVRATVEHPHVVGITWQFLATRDAHALYERFGYTAIDEPDFFMHRRGDG